MFCTNCGASNKNSADLCINCGESLRESHIEDRLARLRALNDAPSPNRFDFLRHLFDFSLHRPVTLEMLRVFRILSVLFTGLLTIFLIFVGYQTSLWLGIFALLTGAASFFLTVIFTRAFCETILVVSRIADRKTDREAADREKPRVQEKAEPREGIQWNV